MKGRDTNKLGSMIREGQGTLRVLMRLKRCGCIGNEHGEEGEIDDWIRPDSRMTNDCRDRIITG